MRLFFILYYNYCCFLSIISCLVIGAVKGNVENTLVSVNSWLITECYSAFTGVKVSHLCIACKLEQYQLPQ